MRRLFFVLILGLATTLAGAQDFAAIPPLTAHVTDKIGMLNAQQRNSLENVLKEYEARTGSQIAILLISKTEPEAIEQYSIRVAEAWKLGRKNVDDGVILVVARDNPKALRRLRIEVGRGVQGTLTDAQSRRILSDVIAPHFRQNDFYGGLSAAVSAITTLMNQEHLPASDKKAVASDDDGFMGNAMPVLIFLAVFIFIVMQARKQRNGLSRNSWGRDSGVILGSGSSWSSSGSSSSSSYSGGGGSFDGGGSSGDW